MKTTLKRTIELLELNDEYMIYFNVYIFNSKRLMIEIEKEYFSNIEKFKNSELYSKYKNTYVSFVRFRDNTLNINIDISIEDLNHEKEN